MLNGVDTVGKGFVCVARMDGNGLRRQHRPLVHAFIRRQMDHHAGVIDFSAREGCQRIVNGMGAGELSGQGPGAGSRPDWESGAESSR